MSAYFKTVIKSILVFLFWPALHAICRRFVPKENFFRLLYLSVNILDFQEVLDRRHAIIIEKYNFFNLLHVTLLTLFFLSGKGRKSKFLKVGKPHVFPIYPNWSVSVMWHFPIIHPEHASSANLKTLRDFNKSRKKARILFWKVWVVRLRE